MTMISQNLRRVQEFVGKLYSTILLLDADDRYFGTGQPGAAAGEYDELHAQFFEDMAALRQEIQNGRALAAIVTEYAARQEDTSKLINLLTQHVPEPLRVSNVLQQGDQLTQALAAQAEAHTILLDAAKELRGDGTRGGQGGGEPPRP